MTTKEKRHEIYKLIEDKYGEMETEFRIHLAQNIVEYSKIHNDAVVAVNNIYKNKLTKLKKQISELKSRQTQTTTEQPKPVKKTARNDEPFFNMDFIQK